MTNAAPPVDGVPDGIAQRRPRHSRNKPYLPTWLTRPGESRAVAQSRCVMILSVLSGHQTVGEAIEEAKICRALYYSLEMRALKGMMKALDPLRAGVADDRQELRVARRQIRSLQEQLKGVTQRKRSAERLLMLVMKSSRAPVNTGRRGRPPKALAMRMMPGADLP